MISTHEFVVNSFSLLLHAQVFMMIRKYIVDNKLVLTTKLYKNSFF